MKSLSRVRLFATPWTVACQAPPSMGFSRQEYWSGLPFPSPGDLPGPGIEPVYPHCRRFFTVWATREALQELKKKKFKSINSLATSLLYGPTATSIHDYWKNHSCDYMDLCRQSSVFAFNMLSLSWPSFQGMCSKICQYAFTTWFYHSIFWFFKIYCERHRQIQIYFIHFKCCIECIVLTKQRISIILLKTQ